MSTYMALIANRHECLCKAPESTRGKIDCIASPCTVQSASSERKYRVYCRRYRWLLGYFSSIFWSTPDTKFLFPFRWEQPWNRLKFIACIVYKTILDLSSNNIPIVLPWFTSSRSTIQVYGFPLIAIFQPVIHTVAVFSCSLSSSHDSSTLRWEILEELCPICEIESICLFCDAKMQSKTESNFLEIDSRTSGLLCRKTGPSVESLGQWQQYRLASVKIVWRDSHVLWTSLIFSTTVLLIGIDLFQILLKTICTFEQFLSKLRDILEI